MKKRKIGKDELKNVGQNQERLLEKNNPIRKAARKFEKKVKLSMTISMSRMRNFQKKHIIDFIKQLTKMIYPILKRLFYY